MEYAPLSDGMYNNLLLCLNNLQWISNVECFHWLPQSLYCDGLFRHIQDYDYVGHMGAEFYDDIHVLSMEFPNTTLPKVLEDVFHFKSKLTHGAGNIGVETSAASHVLEYYTPRTLRRALEYVSIDYVLLGIPIPEWAERMLQEGG